jgi:hypothetical protein
MEKECDMAEKKNESLDKFSGLLADYIKKLHSAPHDDTEEKQMLEELWGNVRRIGPGVAILRDMLQGEKKLAVPEIRVWVHGDKGDTYRVFKSFGTALDFISKTPGAEPFPLVAFAGYEANLWTLRKEG